LLESVETVKAQRLKLQHAGAADRQLLIE